MASTSKLEGLLKDLHDEKDKIQKEISKKEHMVEMNKRMISNLRDPDAGPVAINNAFMVMPDDPDPEMIRREKREIRKMQDFTKRLEREVESLVREKDKVNKHIAGTMDAIRRAKSL